MKNQFERIELKYNLKPAVWDAFVRAHPKKNIFQASLIGEVYKNTKNFDLKQFAAIDSTNKVVALMNAVYMKEKYLSFFTKRGIVQSGPLFLNTPAGRMGVTTILNTYEKTAARNGLLFTQIRMIHDYPELAHLLQNRGYKIEKHINYLIDLTRPVSEIWRNIHKSRRKGINRAEKYGVAVYEVEQRTEIPVMYEFLKNTYNHAKLPLEDISIFYQVFDRLIPTGNAKFFAAYYKDITLAYRIVLLYEGIIYDWHAASNPNREVLKYYPNEYLVWHILRWGAEHEFQQFDFMGAGKASAVYGPGEFKRRFGGVEVDYDRFEKVHKKLRYGVVKKIFDIYRKSS